MAAGFTVVAFQDVFSLGGVAGGMTSDCPRPANTSTQATPVQEHNLNAINGQAEKMVRLRMSSNGQLMARCSI